MSTIQGKKIRILVVQVERRGSSTLRVIGEGKKFDVPTDHSSCRIKVGNRVTFEVRSTRPHGGVYKVTKAFLGRQPGTPKVAEDDTDPRPAKKKRGAK